MGVFRCVVFIFVFKVLVVVTGVVKVQLEAADKIVVVITVDALFVDYNLFTIVVDCLCSGTCFCIISISTISFNNGFKFICRSWTGKELNFQVLDALIFGILVKDRIFVNSTIFIDCSIRHFNDYFAFIVYISLSSRNNFSCQRMVDLADQSFSCAGI